MSLVLKPQSDDKKGELFLVYEGKDCVGRIFHKHAGTGAPISGRGMWFWGLDWFVWGRRKCTLPQYGEADNREQAMAKFRATWDSGK